MSSQKQAIREQIDALHERMKIPEFRMQFRGGSKLEEERCDEYYREWVALKGQVNDLRRQLTEISDAEDAALLLAALKGGAPDSVNVAALDRLFDGDGLCSNKATDARAIIRDWYGFSRTDAEKMAAIRELLA